MSSSRRPGGLTALAVFNFIFGFLGLLQVAGFLVVFYGVAGMAPEDASPEERAVFEAVQDLGSGVYAALVAISLVTVVLLVLSGIGYLKLKRVLGRVLGNAYAIFAVVSALGVGLLMPVELGGGFNLGTLVSLIYPGLTLFLLNVVFKEDLVR